MITINEIAIVTIKIFSIKVASVKGSFKTPPKQAHSIFSFRLRLLTTPYVVAVKIIMVVIKHSKV